MEGQTSAFRVSSELKAVRRCTVRFFKFRCFLAGRRKSDSKGLILFFEHVCSKALLYSLMLVASHVQLNLLTSDLHPPVCAANCSHQVIFKVACVLNCEDTF